MKLNNFAVSTMNLLAKLAFYFLTTWFGVAAAMALANGNLNAFFAALVSWVLGVLIWVFLSAFWLVLSKIAAHLESIDNKTRVVWVGHSEGPIITESFAEKVKEENRDGFPFKL